MGKKRGEGTSEVEDLRGKVRELEKLNKALCKRLGASRKQVDRLESQVALDTEPEPIVAVVEPISKVYCPQCGKAAVTTDLGTRSLLSCKPCGYRKSRKK